MTTDVVTNPGRESDDHAVAKDTTTGGDDRRRYYRACAIGGGIACVAFVALLLNNGGFFQGNILGALYEAQARSLAHGHWDVPKGSIGIEAFVTGDKQYMYYGPWPAVLRMPLMAILPGMDGRWTQPSMLLAFVVALVSTSSLSWNIRNLVRGVDTAVTRVECWGAGLFVFVVGAGSVLLFLASFGWVYHEAELWGAALALAAFAAILTVLLRPTTRGIVAASALASLAILSRPSVGFGPIATMLLLAVVLLTARTRRWFGLPDYDRSRRLVAKVASAGLVPIALYVYVNYAKFGTFFTFPSNRQLFSNLGVYRHEMLAQNNQSLFGAKFFPTAAVQYLRPDALRFRELAPFVNFPRTAPVIGDDVLFDTIEPTSSVTSSMPLLFVLAVVGLVGILRSARSTRTRLPMVRILAIGAMAGAFTVVPYSYIAQRYMSDFVPLLVITGVAGLHLTMRWAAGRKLNVRRLVYGGLAALAFFSLWVNASLGYTYHYETELVSESSALAHHLDRQYQLHDVFPGGSAPYVERGSALPDPPRARGTLFVLGDCEGVYWSQGNTWEPSAKWYAVGRTEKTGQYRLRMRFAPTTGKKRTVQPVVVRGEPGQLQKIVAFVNDKTVRFGFSSEGHDDLPRGRTMNGYFVGPTIKYKPGETYDVDVVMDSNNGGVSVTFGNYPVFAFVQYELTTPQAAHYVFPTDKVTFGRNDLDDTTTPTFNGTIIQDRMKRPFICDTLGIDSPDAGAR